MYYEVLKCCGFLQVMEVNNRGSNEGFTGVIRFVWSVFMMLTTGTSEEEAGTRACLDWACENNVFDFLTTTVLKTAAYQVCVSVVFLANSLLLLVVTFCLNKDVCRH